MHVRTLRAAARDGRLAATFGARPYFGRLTATATRAAAARFMAMWYRRTYPRGRGVHEWQRRTLLDYRLHDGVLEVPVQGCVQALLNHQ